MSILKNKKSRNASYITVVAMLSSISIILFFLKFSVPFVPAFLTLDFSELPALLASFTLGPLAGVVVVLIKNLFHLFFTSTTGVGELANFLIGSSYVLTSGIVYKYRKTKKGAVIGMLLGTIMMSIVGVLSNYYLLMPIYSLVIPMESLINLFSSVNPRADTLFKIMLFTIAPLNLLKGVSLSLIMLFLYKKLSPIIKGRIFS